MVTYSQIEIAHLTEEQHLRTCGYYFTVRANGFAHHGFRTRNALDNWLQERGLALTDNMDEPGAFTIIKGQYRAKMLWSLEQLDALFGYQTRILSNGRYTKAIITTDDAGVRTVYCLGPNVKERITYDHATTRALMDE